MIRCHSWFIAFVVFLLSLEAHGQSAAVQNAHWGWKNVCRSEEEQTKRVARFTGFLEGSYGITAPGIWQMPSDSFRDLMLERISNRSEKVENENYPLCEVDMSTKSVIVTTDEPGIGYVQFECRNKMGGVIWKRELRSAFPKVVFQGPGLLVCEGVASDKYVLLFGRIGEIYLFIALSSDDGKIVDQFGFSPDSDTNLSK